MAAAQDELAILLQSVSENVQDSQTATDESIITEMLISEIQKRPFLFDTRRADFKDKIKKENGWTEVAKLLGVTVERCKKRWRSLRDTFVKEKRKRVKPTGSGCVTRRKWDFFDLLTFLDDSTNLEPTSSNFTSVEVEHLSSASESISTGENAEKPTEGSRSPSSPTEATPLPEVTKRYTRKKRTQSPDKFEKALLETFSKSNCSMDNLSDSKLFALSVGTQLENFWEKKKSLGKIKNNTTHVRHSI